MLPIACTDLTRSSRSPRCIEDGCGPFFEDGGPYYALDNCAETRCGGHCRCRNGWALPLDDPAVGARVTFEPICLLGWVPPAALSPNSRVHWRAKATAVAETRYLVKCHVLRYWFDGGRGEQQGGTRRRLTITVSKPRQSDLDNLTASLKGAIDGAVSGGAARDDSPRWLEVRVQQVKGPPTTWLELEEVAE